MKEDYNILTVGRDKYGYLGLLVDLDRVCTVEDWSNTFVPELQDMTFRVIQDGIFLGEVNGRFYVLDREYNKVFYVSTDNNSVDNAVWCESKELPVEISQAAEVIVALADTLTYNDVACALGLL